MNLRTLSLFAAPLFAWFGMLSCQGPSEHSIEAAEFKAQLEAQVDASLLDVRTAEEFATGHIAGATNIDWNSDRFEDEVSKLEREKKVFVYCLSGPRSRSAAAKLRKMGFAEVVELRGGMMSWRARSLPEEGSGSEGGTSVEAFNRITSSELPVMIDFYAEWCAPCQKMKPDLEKLESEAGGLYRVVRVDADASRALCAQLGVEALPELRIYVSGDEVWNHKGYLGYADMKKALSAAVEGKI